VHVLLAGASSMSSSRLGVAAVAKSKSILSNDYHCLNLSVLVEISAASSDIQNAVYIIIVL